MAVNENVAVGTVVGTVTTATDPDSSGQAFGQQRYYFWNGSAVSATSADGRYTINATTGQITTAAALNFEAGTPSVSYTIAARDNAGAAGYTQATNTVTIAITDLNEQIARRDHGDGDQRERRGRNYRGHGAGGDRTAIRSLTKRYTT